MFQHFLLFVCLAVFIGQVQNWPLPFLYDRPIPITFVRTSIEHDDGGDSASIFHEMQTMMNQMHHRFERMFGWPSWFQNFNYQDETWPNEPEENLAGEIHHVDNLIKQEKPVNDLMKQLDGVQPVCTTVVNSPTTISPRKSRRKKQRTTQTKTCVKELIVNGEKHILVEETTTDDQGVLIKQSKNYTQVSISSQTNNSTGTGTETELPDY